MVAVAAPPHPPHSAASFDYGFEMLAAHALEFDGVVFIDHTSASRLLR
jgi:hypothetical protein